MGKHNCFKLETNDEIRIPTPEEIQEFEDSLIDHEAFLIVMEWQEKLREKQNPLDKG